MKTRQWPAQLPARASLRKACTGVPRLARIVLAQPDQVVAGALQADVRDMEALHTNAVPHRVLHPYDALPCESGAHSWQGVRVDTTRV